MDVRFSIELPPLPAYAARGGATAPRLWRARAPRLWRAAAAAARGGIRAVWFSGPAHGARTACDPAVLAAGALGFPEPPLLGVVVPVPSGRHPALVARELTALDIVTGGRAAVLLRWDGPPGGGPIEAAAEQLAEAAAVCRMVLGGEEPVFEGRHLHVAGARNKPRPLQEGGPPIFVQVPSGWPRLAREEPGARAFAAMLAGAAAAVVSAGDDREVAECRRLLDDLEASRPSERPPQLIRLVDGLALGRPEIAALGSAPGDGAIFRIADHAAASDDDDLVQAVVDLVDLVCDVGGDLTDAGLKRPS